MRPVTEILVRIASCIVIGRFIGDLISTIVKHL